MMIVMEGIQVLSWLWEDREALLIEVHEFFDGIPKNQVSSHDFISG